MVSRSVGSLGLVSRAMASAAGSGGGTEFVVAYVTAPVDKASALAKGLVTAKLAACVNIVPKVQSVYEWEGKVEEDEESLLIVKTRAASVGAIGEWLAEHHPYDVPELIALPIQAGSIPYLDWMKDVLK